MTWRLVKMFDGDGHPAYMIKDIELGHRWPLSQEVRRQNNFIGGTPEELKESYQAMIEQAFSLPIVVWRPERFEDEDVAL